MRITLIISLVGFAFVLKAQEFSTDIYHDGFLITQEGDTVRGLLQYDMEANIVSMIVKGKAKTFSSHKIFYFEINDSLLNTYRRFYSLPYKVNYSYEIPILFELLYEGSLSLLSREAVVQETVNSTSAYWGGSSSIRSIVRHTYFFLNAKGKISYFSGRKKDLYTIMINKQVHVKNFIKENKLLANDIRDLIRITVFYNSI